MPEISRFLGMKIFMYFNEHNPPHFHVEYNEYKASININTFGVMEGKLPSKVYRFSCWMGERPSKRTYWKLEYN